MLGANVVRDSHVREITLTDRRRRVVRRGRESTPDLIRQDDEILVRVQRHLLAHVDFHVLARPRVHMWKEDSIVLLVAQFAEGRIGDSAVPQCFALLQFERIHRE